MPLAMILRPPSTKNGMDEWFFSHAQDHLEVVQKIQALFGIVLPTYILDPVLPQDMKGWAHRHQSFHDDANAVLGTSGSDLQTVEWDDNEQRENWMFLNFAEHQDWHKRLGS